MQFSKRDLRQREDGLNRAEPDTRASETRIDMNLSGITLHIIHITPEQSVLISFLFSKISVKEKLS